MVRISLSALGGAQLNVEQEGSGPPVVALHGFTGSASTWAPLAAAAQGDFSVVAVDLPGHGASDAPDDPSCYSMERHIRCLAELLDHLGLQRVHWLGYSLGGRIALSAAIALPQRTASLVVESASPGLATAGERAVRVAEDERLADWTEEVGIERFVDYWQAIPLWASQARLPVATRDRLRAQRLTSNPVGLANSLRGVGAGAQPPLHRRLGELSVATLFIAGEDDAKYVAIAEEMHQAVAGSRLEIIAGAGHAAHLEQRERFHQVALGFLKVVASARGLRSR